MQPYYSLSVSEYRHPREVIVRNLCLLVGIGTMALVFLSNPKLVGSILFILFMLMLTFFMQVRSFPANCVRVSPAQFPEIYQLATDAAAGLQVTMPAIYIQQSPILNAFSIGLGDSRYVVLHSAIVETMNQGELQYIIGHELGHLKANHTLYGLLTNNTLVNNPLLKAILGPVQFVLGLIFNSLSRYQEYSCDRAGLVASGGDVYSAIAAQTKLAIGKEMFNKIDLKEYLRQIQDFKGGQLNFLAEINQDHPFAANRVRNILEFYRSTQFHEIQIKQGKNQRPAGCEPHMGTVQVFDNILQQRGQQASAQQAAMPGGKPVLRGVAGHFLHNEITLSDRPVYIGRDPSMAQIIFPSDTKEVSRRHASIRYDAVNRQFILEDCQSVNGTFRATGERLEAGRSYRLKTGERFYLSNPENMFELQLE